LPIAGDLIVSKPSANRTPSAFKLQSLLRHRFPMQGGLSAYEMPASGKPAEQNGAGKYVAVIVFLSYHPLGSELSHGMRVGNISSEVTRQTKANTHTTNAYFYEEPWKSIVSAIDETNN
jgi:hypothetical protein